MKFMENLVNLSIRDNHLLKLKFSITIVLEKILFFKRSFL
jgi:hypothetical protein